MLQKTDFDPFLKEYWSDSRMEQLTYQYRPFLAMCPKDTKVGGEYVVVPVDVDDGADGSPTFADAQAVATTVGTDAFRKQFQVQVVEDFQLAQISNKLIRLTRDTPRLALQRAVDETKKKKNILAARLARAMYRSGVGEIGTVDSSVSALNTKIIGLSNKQDARNFRIGQRVVFASTLTAALRDSGDYVTVTAVDYDNAKITTDAPVDLSTSIALIATGDIIFTKGSRTVGAATTPTLLTMQGLASWCPSTAPSGGENFNNVDRSIWPDRMAGLRYKAGVAQSGPIQEILIDSLVDAAIREVYPSHIFMDPFFYGQAIMAMEGTVVRINEAGTNTRGEKTRIGFEGFSLSVGYGNGGTKVFPDANQLPKTHHALTLDTWVLGSAGELIQNDLQAGSSRDVENASAVEYRYVFCGEFHTGAPGKNQVVKYA